MSVPDISSSDPILKSVLGEKQRRASEKATGSFRDFFEQAWPVMEPGCPLVKGWHLDAICEHLQAVSMGQIKRLLVTVPPGHCKSLTTSVAWPAWQWIEKDRKKFPASGPRWRSIATSYSETLSTRDSVRCRALLESPWFQSAFAPKWSWSSDQNIKTWFENSEKGSRISLGVGGSATGIRADAILCDDPLNAKDQFSSNVLENCIFWWDQVMSSRLNNMATGAKIIIMQRLSQMDLAAHVLSGGDYDHLNLMTEFEPERRTVTSIGWQDPRQDRGELLFPEMFGPAVVAGIKRDLGTSGFSSQHQQRPSPSEGGIIKRQWWRYWKRPGDPWGPVKVRMPDGDVKTIEPVELPDIDEMMQSWDMSFKNVRDADYVAGQVWGRKGSTRFLLDQIHRRMGITETLEAVRKMTKEWPRATLKLVEDKANGPAVIEMLRHEISGMVAVNPHGGKEARAQAIAPTVEAGNVFLPHPSMCPWVSDLIDECAELPRGRHDDMCDALTQGINRWLSGGSLGVIEYLKSEYKEQQESEVKRKEAIAVADKAESCPSCKSIGVRWISQSQGFRCQQCGFQFGGAVIDVYRPSRSVGDGRVKGLIGASR